MNLPRVLAAIPFARDLGMMQARRAVNLPRVLVELFLFFCPFAPGDLLSGDFGEVYSCTVCHSDKKSEFIEDIHYRRGILCDECHGGNASIMSEEAHSSSYGSKRRRKGGKEPFTKKQIVSLCSSCHSDARMMMSYGIPSNQEALYQISPHGKAVFGKDCQDAAVCTDCHGTHRILPASDPKSSVYMANLPATCTTCHADEALMEKYGLPSDIGDRFKGSVHGKALLEKHDTRAPNCAICHGVHGATPPQITEIENVCGQCHDRTRNLFNEGPHKKAMGESMMEECISCHGSHSIKRASFELYDEVCADCHDPSSGAYRRGQRIKALVIEAAGSIEEAKARILEAGRIGLDTEAYYQEIEDAETALMCIAPESHALSVEGIEKLARAAVVIAGDVKLDIYHRMEERKMRRLALLILWGFITVVVPATLMKKYRAGELRQRGR